VNLNFRVRHWKNPQIKKFMKTRPVGAALIYADGQTFRHDKANIRFSQLCESTYNVYVHDTCILDVRYAQNERRTRLLAHRQESEIGATGQ
jgi:hypothetical protein